jgi:hypothetical protein
MGRANILIEHRNIRNGGLVWIVATSAQLLLPMSA